MPIYKKEILECPCGDYKFTVKYESELKFNDHIFCPFCSVEIEEETEQNEDDE